MSEWISVEERLPYEEWLEHTTNTDWDVYPLLAVVVSNLVGKRYVTKLFYTGENFVDAEYVRYTAEVTHWMPLPEPPSTVAKKERVRCGDCKHLMYSDCYGECGAGHRGIVRPDDTCPYGERRGDDGTAQA